jgi:hypothetical protein
MKSTAVGTRTIGSQKDDFFRVVIEERKKLPKSHPHYQLRGEVAVSVNPFLGLKSWIADRPCASDRSKD